MNKRLLEKLEGLLFKTNKPYQYIGNEYLSANKDFASADVTIALGFPDKYEIGISNLGHKILYDIVNRQKGFMADRFYAPDNDFLEHLTTRNVLLYGLESGESISDFDLVGLSLQYELSYPTLLKMLELGNISVKNENRAENEPIVLAGGPCAYNPEPMAQFIDAFLIGDGEDLILEVLESIKSAKQNNLSRVEKLKSLANLEGVYVPALYDHSAKTPKPICPEAKTKVTKRIKDLNETECVEFFPIPHSSAVHDRTTVEIRRGCGRMCRFCQSGHINLPIRELDAQKVIQKTKSLAQKTGYDEFSLLSLSSNDYSNIESVLEELTCEMKHKGISASLPSQRIDRYSIKLANLLQQVRKTTTTLAPEAGSQRLRDVINKNLTKEQIINTAMVCYKNGISSLKFYFMLGLPTETYEDIDETLALLKEIIWEANKYKRENNLKNALTITCSMSIFVPKPFTPFQWCAQETDEELYKKIGYIKDREKGIKGVRINIHGSFMSMLEAVITKGDYNLGEYIHALYKNGCYLDTWRENFEKDVWLDTARDLGIDLNRTAQKQIPLDEDLPWDLIDIGIDKSWFMSEYKKSLETETTTPCEFGCAECGVCTNLKTKKITAKPYTPDLSFTPEEKAGTFKYRLKLAKTDHLKYLSHLDWQNLIIKMLYRSELDLVFSQGFNPSPKISFSSALPIFMQSACELIDIELHNNINPEQLRQIFQSVLPKECEILTIVKIDKSAKSIDKTVHWALYEFAPLKKELPNSDSLRYIIDEVLTKDDLFIEKKNKKGITKKVNIKHSINVARIQDNKLQMILKVGQDSEIPPLRADVAIRYFLPDEDFNITRLELYSSNLEQI